MKLRFRLLQVVSPEWVDSVPDCAFRTARCRPGYAVLVTTSPVPTSQLPNAEAKQFGHDTATGYITVSRREARQMFRVADTVELEVEPTWRNREKRADGTFRCRRK